MSSKQSAFASIAKGKAPFSTPLIPSSKTSNFNGVFASVSRLYGIFSFLFPGANADKVYVPASLSKQFVSISRVKDEEHLSNENVEMKAASSQLAGSKRKFDDSPSGKENKESKDNNAAAAKRARSSVIRPNSLSLAGLPQAIGRVNNFTPGTGKDSMKLLKRCIVS